VSTPHTTGFGVGGFPRERWLAYEREKARGGAGTIMMFGSASVHPSSPVAAAGGIEYWDPAIIPHLQAMADGVHEWGGLCLAQVSHWGRGGDGRYADEPLLAPSDEPDETHHGIPRALTKAEIHVLILVAAVRFDGNELSPLNSVLGTDPRLIAMRRQLEDFDRVTARPAFGPPVEELNAFGEEVDLLLLGSPSEGPKGQLVADRTAKRLARASRCPLLVIPLPSAPPEFAGNGRAQREAGARLRAMP